MKQSKSLRHGRTDIYDPARPCRGSGGFAARHRSWCFTPHRDCSSDFVADPEALYRACRIASATLEDSGEVATSAKNSVPRPQASTGVSKSSLRITEAKRLPTYSGKRSSPFHDKASRARFGSRSRPDPESSSLLKSSPRSASERMRLPLPRPVDGNSVERSNSIAAFWDLGKRK